MLKPSVLCTWVDNVGATQLLDAAQAVKGRVAHNVKQQAAWHTNEAENGIVNGNAVNTEMTLTENTHDTLVISPDKKKLIAIKGLEDYMVIDTDDVLVICPKDDKKFKDFISGIAMPEYEKYR